VIALLSGVARADDAVAACAHVGAVLAVATGKQVAAQRPDIKESDAIAAAAILMASPGYVAYVNRTPR
jgi:hypothetical protein